MKKKSLLLAISAMSIAAIGVGTVGTFAWYTASQSATLANVEATHGSISTVASTITTGNYYLRVEFSSVTESVALSDKAGNTFGVVNGKLVAATGTTRGSYVLTPKAYHEEACTNELSAAEIASLLDSTKTYNVTLTPSARVRLTMSSTAADVYSATVNTAITTGVTVSISVSAGSGALKINDADTVTGYFSISGSTPDGTASAGTSASPEALGSVTGTITSSIEVNS